MTSTVAVASEWPDVKN